MIVIFCWLHSCCLKDLFCSQRILTPSSNYLFSWCRSSVPEVYPCWCHPTPVCIGSHHRRVFRVPLRWLFLVRRRSFSSTGSLVMDHILEVVSLCTCLKSIFLSYEGKILDRSYWWQVSPTPEFGIPQVKTLHLTLLYEGFDFGFLLFELAETLSPLLWMSQLKL